MIISSLIDSNTQNIFISESKNNLCFIKVRANISSKIFFIDFEVLVCRDEVRISELSEIRSYSDHFGDRKSMPQIRILEYTIFRAFFRDFHHFPPHFRPSSENYLFSPFVLFLWYKKVAKNEENILEEHNEENDEENGEENDENHKKML